jgi:hypothetical protein
VSGLPLAAPRAQRSRISIRYVGTATDVAPGQALCIRRGAIHHFDNHGDVDAKVLAVASPGVFGPDYFREIAAVFEDSSGGAPDIARIGEVMRRHGLTPAPPPAG